MKQKKQTELKALSQRTKNILALISLTVLVVFLWLFFSAQLEHRNRHYAEDFTKLQNLEIKDLEEVVIKDPNNFSAWKLLGLKHRQNKNYAKAKESWKRALEVAHTEGEVAWLKEKLAHIDEQHN